ncbi:hypothetical protein PLESTB_001558700, partial [Pleodorina starrii]
AAGLHRRLGRRCRRAHPPGRHPGALPAGPAGHARVDDQGELYRQRYPTGRLRRRRRHRTHPELQIAPV